MKTIKDFRLPLLVLFGSLIIVLFTSYGNKKVHPDLNSIMVERFLKNYRDMEFGGNTFDNYTFEFGSRVQLKGTAIKKDGLFSSGDPAAGILGLIATGAEYNNVFNVYSEEGPDAMSPKEWISHGGYSADVPEVPASLRHFYDPTQHPGDRYLTDIANAKVMGEIQNAFTNPRIDGVEWAIGTPGHTAPGVQDHQYTWERGKIWIQMALKETDKDKRDEYMAKAWRSLGETLHMIADNGCPAHVRNDAHPSPLWPKNDWFGNPDPYEEYIDIIRRDSGTKILDMAKGAPDENLRKQFMKLKKVRDIADTLAVFTNANFVTNETISGSDKSGKVITQRIHPASPYSSPLLHHMTYRKADYAYFSGSGIRQCTDHYYLAPKIPMWCDPYVDMECVQSQAQALLPNIIEAGANVIKLFIPKLTVELKPIEQEMLSGEIKHVKDIEYPNEIKYSGEVILIIKDNKNKEKEKILVQAKEGKFEKEGFVLEKDEQVIAQIKIGGIEIESASANYTGTWILYGKNTSFLSNGKPKKLLPDQYLGGIVLSDLENNSQYRKVTVSRQGGTIILRCEGSVNNWDPNSLDVFQITNVTESSIEGTAVCKHIDVMGNKTETHFTLYGQKVK